MKKYLIGGAVLLLVIAALVWQLVLKDDAPRTPKTIEPLDVTLAFFSDWREALATSSAPSVSDLLATTTVTTALRDRLLADIGEDMNKAKETLFCGTDLPNRVRAKVVYENASSSAEMLVMAKYDNASSTNSLPFVKLVFEAPFWRIDSISCSAGDVIPDREYSFEQTGRLLKQVPKPYDSTQWHLVFTEDGTPGHVAMLIFTPESRCTENGTTTPCDPGALKETAEAKIQGQATESGITVVNLDLI
jgi:hypothetical protein